MTFAGADRAGSADAGILGPGAPDPVLLDPEVSGPAPVDLAVSGTTPGRLAVGLGLRPGLPADHLLAVLREAFPGVRITCLATIDRRAAEPGVRQAATALGVPVHGFAAEQLATVVVPNPSERVAAAVGVAGVAESAALVAGIGDLVVPRRVVSGVVIAAARAS